ncbi:site-specific DNA-methyltransferase [Nostoc sp.]|uniref:site-specific DNA-methyltransferase n=1 Tax=Nostoc sp. TaxID=1180 RepID=UPI002FF562A7
MATGITKREQLSANAISALDLGVEEVPLPEEKASVELIYQNKAALEDIICIVPRTFLCIGAKPIYTVQSLTDNSFIIDDNFFVLNELIAQGRKATLFYLDPPYGTGFDFQSRDLEHAYKDSMGQAAYIEFMRRRLTLMRECMTDDGSIYVHIGYQMLAHLKVIMDEIFGSGNFRNLITRRKCSSKNFTSRQFANTNDFILFYTKKRSYKWNQPKIEAEDEWVLKEYPKIDAFGRRYKLVPIHAPGTRNGETGQPWQNMMPPPGKHWQYTPSKLEELDRQGDIHWSKNGNPRRKVYWSSEKRRTLSDYWDQYRDAHHQSIKITGYPTEKNFEMIKMIVGASSEVGDLVVDPFCGSGTTLQAAQTLDRRFIGVDASFTAAKATLRRMRHGVEAMGDYVNVKRPKTVQILLPRLSDSEAECAFFVNQRLYDAYPEAIAELARI